MSIKKISQQCKFCGGWTTSVGGRFISLCPSCNVSFKQFNVSNEVKKHGRKTKDAYHIAKKISKSHGKPTPSTFLIKQITDLL